MRRGFRGCLQSFQGVPARAPNPKSTTDEHKCCKAISEAFIAMPCSHCGAEKLLARGLCSACYHRLRKTGSVVRKNVRNIGPCLVSGCGQPSHAKGLCSLHYARQFHPLRNTWKNIRSRYPIDTPPHWDRFDRFLADVGERPSRHQLRRRDDARPYSMNNVCWIEPVVSSRADYFTPQKRSAYSREHTLTRKYGIGGIEYKQLLNHQNYKCAICREEESFINPKTGKVQELSVDHDHLTRIVRGLLCRRCNRMLGFARDDIAILQRAITYLRQHKKPSRAEVGKPRISPRSSFASGDSM
jgi:hypothetical protein